jgi:dimethylhistidine N-methyltransferase
VTLRTDDAPRIHWPGPADFAGDVRRHLTLTPRQLPSWYLYDALGSALFEAISELPWYGVPRAEARLLTAHRHDVLATLEPLTTIVELGPGTGRKLRLLLGGEHLIGAPAADGHAGALTVDLVDVSATALATAAQTLSDIDNLTVVTHEAAFEAGLDDVRRRPRPAGRTLMLFLGSNIGNFDPPASAALLDNIRSAMTPHDALLLGADLVKPERDLLLAYDDPLGVSAAFNRNVLVRINRELGGHFDLAAFRHRAVWNAALSRMEMYLVAASRQRVRIDAIDLEVDLAAGESIWTESSYKFQPDEIVTLVEGAGFRRMCQWIDAADPFALTLFDAV